MMNQTGMNNMWPGSQQPQLTEGPRDVPRTPAANNPNQGFFFDQETNTRLRQLEMDKAIAVQNENYEQAKSLRNQIDRLKSVGVQLSSLDAQKQLAVSTENYDQARKIKDEMDRIRQQALATASGG